MFIITIQVFFLVGILYFNKQQFKLYNNTLLQLCLFFTTLLLHMGNLPIFRSGLYMMKYTLCHPEEFTHPKIAFGLGLFYNFFLVVSELVNIAKGTQRKTPQDLITSYIGFKIITDLPKIYLASMGSTIPIKAAIGKLKATKGRKDPGNAQYHNWFLNAIYVLIKWFYNSVYFYFFPFGVIYLPLLFLLFDKE